MLPNLHALRFFLALIVVLFHVPTISQTLGFAHYADAPIFHKGELSVFYFFTLSGFLIIRLIYVELLETNTINFLRFYKRRAARILPPYLLVLGVGLFLYNFLLPYLGIPFAVDYGLIEALFYNIFFLSNVFKTIYPNIGGILSVLWSIGVEEQFYLLCPPLMLLFKKQLNRFLIGTICLLFEVLYFYPSFYQFDNFFFYFAFGGLIGMLAIQEKLNWLKKTAFQIILLLLFVISFFTNLLELLPPLAYHFTTMMISGLLIYAISHQPIWTIQNKWVNALGKISYGIYLYHMIVLTGVLFIFQKAVALGLVLSDFQQILLINTATISITIWVAWLSNKYFESLFYRKP